MIISIHQPNYAPWCGYFTKIISSDKFVFLDDVQMPGGQSFVYRTKILNGGEEKWLSIPTKHHFGDLINEVKPDKEDWSSRHLSLLMNCYKSSSYFKEVFPVLQTVYEEPGDSISTFNKKLILCICDFLNIKCKFINSSNLPHEGSGDDRLISILRYLEADKYLSGKGGMNYQDPKKFSDNGIKLEIMEYKPIPYNQSLPRFIPGLSILDALFNEGISTIKLLRYET
ncbi:MAG: WbqC family protein [Anaerolineaceae bacterium]